jgi:stringent starvation protein B
MLDSKETTATRPYLIRALYEWCTDNGLTPYVAVMVDETVKVPKEYVKNNEIVLNISFDATSSLSLGNDFIEFKARFAGISREIVVPINRVIAIYARENGQGMAFPLHDASQIQPQSAPLLPGADSVSPVRSEAKLHQLPPVAQESTGEEPEPPRPTTGARPSLKRVK